MAPVGEPGGEGGGGHGVGDVVALGVGAAETLEEIPVLAGFDADGDGHAIKAVREIQAAA